MILTALLLAAAAPAANTAAATRTFQKCASCHAIDPEEADMPGPNLHGVIGRRAGTAPDYVSSDALIKAGAAGLVWTRETLERFLTDPESLVPGNVMGKPPSTTPEEREQLFGLFSSTN